MSSYGTVPNFDLFKLPVAELVSGRAGALVAVWVTNRPRFIEFVQTSLFAAWGLAPVALWHWLKVRSRLAFPALALASGAP